MKQNVKASDNLAREFFEKDLEFLGFLIFENKIKQAVPPLLEELSQAGISFLMLTGDTPSTAIFTARHCGIIDKSQRVALGTLEKLDAGNNSSTKIRWLWIDFSGKDELYKGEEKFCERIEMPGSYNALEESAAVNFPCRNHFAHFIRTGMVHYRIWTIWNFQVC